jgi:hypothetical protein
VAAGVNVTCAVQLAPGIRLELQGFWAELIEKSLASTPPIDSPFKEIGFEPVFVTVNVCGTENPT